MAKLLEWVLGPHHGIIYRRTGKYSVQSAFVKLTNIFLELKELIAMHSSLGEYGGDLKNDTVTIIGATLDLQEKVVSQVIVVVHNSVYATCSSATGDDPNQRRFYAVDRC